MIGASSYGYTRYRITKRRSPASQPSVFVRMLCLVPLNPLLLLHSKTNISFTGLFLTFFSYKKCCFSIQHNSLLLWHLPSILRRNRRPWYRSDKFTRGEEDIGITPLLYGKLLWDCIQDRGWQGEMDSLCFPCSCRQGSFCQITFHRNFSARRSTL